MAAADRGPAFAQRIPPGSVALALDDAESGQTVNVIALSDEGVITGTVNAETSFREVSLVEVGEDGRANPISVEGANVSGLLFNGIIIDQARRETTLDDGDSDSFRISTVAASNVVLFVDDGTTDQAASAYQLTERVLFTEQSFQVDQSTPTDGGNPALEVESSAIPPTYEFEVQNVSGNDDQNYRMRAVAISMGSRS